MNKDCTKDSFILENTIEIYKTENIEEESNPAIKK